MDFEDLLQRPAWHARAACRDTNPVVFFPRPGESDGVARRICAECPVREQCEQAGMGEGGIWGGLSERQRRRMRSRRVAP